MFQVAIETMPQALVPNPAAATPLEACATWLGIGLAQAGARMALDENRRAATLKVVSTGSAAVGRSQPALGHSTPTQTKTLGPGALDRGFLGAFVTLDGAAYRRLGQQGGNPSQTAPSGTVLGPFDLLAHEQSSAIGRDLSHQPHALRQAVESHRRTVERGSL